MSTLMQEHETLREQAMPLVREVMELLPGQWGALDANAQTMLYVREDGMRLLFHVLTYPHSQKGRVEVSINWSKEMNAVAYDLSHPSITTAHTAKASTVAKRVSKMLDETAEEFERTKERVAAYKVREDQQASVLATLATSPLVNRVDTETGRFHLRGQEFYGDGQARSESVSLELRGISPEQAQQILKMLS